MPQSSRKKPLVIVTRKLPDAIETRLMELFETRLNADDKPLGQAALIEAVKAADVLVPTVTDRIDSRVLAQAGPRLKLIASFGTGVDHIDLDGARQRGITVTNTPGVLTDDTADMTMALVLATARRMGAGERLVREGKWTGWSPTSMLGSRLQYLAPLGGYATPLKAGRRAKARPKRNGSRPLSPRPASPAQRRSASPPRPTCAPISRREHWGRSRPKAARYAWQGPMVLWMLRRPTHCWPASKRRCSQARARSRG